MLSSCCYFEATALASRPSQLICAGCRVQIMIRIAVTCEDCRATRTVAEKRRLMHQAARARLMEVPSELLV